MMLFWGLAALLVMVALAFVLPALVRRGARGADGSPDVAAAPAAPSSNRALNIAVYRDQQRELEADQRAGVLTSEQYERARLELERRLLDDVAASETAVVDAAAARPASRAPALVVGILLPLAAVGLYLVVGNPRALSPAALPQDASKGVTAAQVEAMVSKLAERMKQNPDDAQGWAMLGKSYAVMGRFEDAASAYAKAAERAPGNPHVLADYADALAMARGQSLQGEPETLVLRALQIDPDHAKSLALAGTAAFERKDYSGALKHWERLAATLPPDSEMARDVQASIAEARGLLGGGKDARVQSAGAASGVSGTVTLAPALKKKAAPGDTVFIFARAAEGPRMPLAIIRKKVSDLPFTFTLDDSLAMSPQSRLSGAPQVIVGARISKTGEAAPRPGDLQGASKPVGNTSTGVAVVIDTEVH